MKHINYLSCAMILFSFFIVSCTKEEEEPVAGFTMSKTSVDVDETVEFTNNSENAVTYLWDFGDGNTSTDEHPAHSYSSGGNFTITLTATGDGGKDTYTQTIEVSLTISGTWNITFSIIGSSYDGLLEIKQHSNNLISGSINVYDFEYTTSILSLSIIYGPKATIEWMSVGASPPYRYTLVGYVKNNFTYMSGSVYIYSFSGESVGNWSASKSLTKSAVIETEYNKTPSIEQLLITLEK